MAWTIAVISALLGFAGILLLLNKSFDKSKQGIKTLMTMFSLGILIIIAQAIKLIAADKASVAITSALDKLTTANLIVTIALFSFFILYFIITYFVGLTKAMKDSKKEKEEMSWNA